ncbi:MAG: hypothetical protein AB1389_02670, partial [Campylobacterota bacterium]
NTPCSEAKSRRAKPEDNTPCSEAKSRRAKPEDNTLKLNLHHTIKTKIILFNYTFLCYNTLTILVIGE